VPSTWRVLSLFLSGLEKACKSRWKKRSYICVAQYLKKIHVILPSRASPLYGREGYDAGVPCDAAQPRRMNGEAAWKFPNCSPWRTECETKQVEGCQWRGISKRDQDEK